MTSGVLARTVPPQPTLVVWGEHDPVLPLAVGRRLVASIGHAARLEVIPETRHVPNLERPELVNALMLPFFDR